MTVTEAAEKIIKQAKTAPGTVIAIDGRSCAGKTTLAASLAGKTGAYVVHMDDFFLPRELREPERRLIPGGNVHFERFESEVLPFLGSEPFSYGVFDCSVMEITSYRRIPAGTVIVEGAYSMSPRFGKYWDFSVFLDIDAKTQRERILLRNGKTQLEAFERLWIPLEERYFSFYDIQNAADAVMRI